MTSSTIAQVLKERGAWLKRARGDEAGARNRAALSRTIASNYASFERLRDAVMQGEGRSGSDDSLAPADCAEAQELLKLMREAGLNPAVISTEARRYLTGGWLEELAWLAALSAGADEALYGQAVGWEVKGFTGENEIDLIMRKGRALSFVSCKALRSALDINDKKHRNRLMDAVHEADNLADHFGQNDEKVAVLVTTDLYDELRETPRYQSLMGKAAVLDVRVIALEELQWDKLLEAFREMMPAEM